MPVNLGFLVWILQAIFAWVMPWVGLFCLLGLVAFKLAPYLPKRASLPIAKKALYAAVNILGPDLMLLRDEEGRYTLAPYEYDADNGIIWVDYGEELLGFDAGGMGGQALPFANGSLVLGYQGLGSAADIVSARLGYEARQKHGTHARDNPSLPGATDALADGGIQPPEDIDLEETEVTLPERGVVTDLRDVMSLAPFDIRPDVLQRVEKNAKASQQKFGNWGAVAQIGGMMGAFFMGGLLVWFAMRDGDGGSSVDSVSVSVVEALLTGVVG